MQPYQNLSGSSGVSAFEIGSNFIEVKFGDGYTYRYTYASAGPNNIERMKRLALGGEGLSTFISRSVQDDYEARW